MKILILGCGWVGEELALTMLSQGYEVWASVTSAEKQQRFVEKGIRCFVYNFDEEEQSVISIPTDFDYVLTSIPASSKHEQEILKLRFYRVYGFLQQLNYQKHIYLSSVGIYPDVSAVFDEFTTGYSLNVRLLSVEQIMLKLPNTIIFRLGGLFGKSRIFAKYFEHKVCTTAMQPANFVHLDDVVTLIMLGFRKLKEYGIFNIVCPEHPTKREVIEASALKYGYQLPSVFAGEKAEQKIVNSERIITTLDYTFKYSSPLDF